MPDTCAVQTYAMSRLPALRPVLALVLATPIAAIGLVAGAAPASAVPGECTEVSDPSRYSNAGTPDVGLANPILSAHRGGTTIAPEHTLEAYKTAAAYGIDVLEVDVRTTADEQQVVIHDDTLDRTTDVEVKFPTRSPWNVRDFTLAEIRTLNAADYGPFALSAPANPKQAYNPALVPTVDEILDLAGRVGAGIEADLKDAQFPDQVVAKARDVGIISKSFFGEPERPDVRARILTVAPDAQFIYNIGSEPPAALYTIASTGVRYFGSSLNEFTPEVIAAIHDGCGLALPHAYDSNPPTSEFQDILIGRSKGSDGAQIDTPDAAVDAVDRPVATRLELRDGRACLLNAVNGLGLPYKPLVLDGAAGPATSKDGCVTLPAPVGTELRFAGDGSALASSAALAAEPVVPEVGLPALLPLAGLAVAAGVMVRRRARLS